MLRGLTISLFLLSIAGCATRGPMLQEDPSRLPEPTNAAVRKLDCPILFKFSAGNYSALAKRTDLDGTLMLKSASYSYDVTSLIKDGARDRIGNYIFTTSADAPLRDSFVGEFNLKTSALSVSGDNAKYRVAIDLNIMPPGRDSSIARFSSASQKQSLFTEGQMPDAVYIAIGEALDDLARQVADSREINLECSTYFAGNDERKEEPNKVSLTTPTDSGKLWALLVGVSDYTDAKIPDLQYASSDAIKVENTLRAVGVPDSQILVLTDSEASSNELRASISSHLSKAAPTDTVLFYFSGHGAADPTGQTSGYGDGFQKYLLTSDTRIDKMSGYALSMNDLNDLIGQLPSKRRVLVIDSCFAGSMSEEVVSAKSVTALTPFKSKAIGLSDEYLVNVVARDQGVPARVAPELASSTVTLVSSRADQLSREYPELKGSVFTHFLSESLRDQATDSNRDGRLGVDEVFDSIHPKVLQYTLNQQEPLMRPAPSFPIFVSRVRP